MLKTVIEAKLIEAFSPLSLKVVDESHLHVGHGNYKPGGESHFNVTIVSAAFCGLSRLQRHQRVYACLKDELKRVHALSLKALSPEDAAEATVPE